jgi:cell shape-determining protein MreC
MSPYRNTSSRNTTRTVVVTISVLVVTYVIVSSIRTFRSATPLLYGDVLSLQTQSKASLIKKITQLQSTLDAQNASLLSLATLEKENAALKAELGRQGEAKGILAHVVVPPNRSMYDTVILDVGSDDGVTVGQSVYAFGSVALGTISDVSPTSSTVLLYSASGRQTVGTTTASSIIVTLIGRGGGEYEVRMPRDISFQEGDVITEQSLAVHPLATIQKIVTDPRDPFQRLLAKIPVNLQTMKWVVVK